MDPNKQWNVNAASFVPRASAASFVPGQQWNTPPPMNMHPQQHFVPPPPQYMPPHQQQQQYIPPQQQFVPPSQQFVPPPPQYQQQPPPSTQPDHWDEDVPLEEPSAPTPPSDPAPPPAVKDSTPAAATATSPPQQAPPADEPVKQKDTADDEKIAALGKKFERAVFVDDGTHKEHVNIVFIGHVDAGKSTIGGHLMFLTGMVDKRTLEKYEKEAKEKGRETWYLSWALDTNEEEREKGKTVECGRAYFETEKKHFTILDAPGHKSYVPNMINGANQADLAVLVISARKGEFETGFDRGGQTREHAMLVKTAGVKHLVILVNKMDDPSVGWSQERYDEIEGRLTPYLKKCGFNPKTDITYIPCSGFTGEFLKERPSLAEHGGWYTGPCFIEYIDNMLPSISRDFNGPVRCIVHDKFTDMGTVVIGKMESGCVIKGQNLVIMPNKSVVQVVQIWSDEIETDRVVCGDNIRFKLKGVEESDVQTGFIICSPDALVSVSRIFDAEVVILEHKSIIAPGYSCVMHIQSAIEEVIVKNVICTMDKKTGEKKKARFVRQDEKAILRFESSEAFCLEPFKVLPQLGRFTLRDEGKTIAIGKVLKVVDSA